MSVTTMIDLKRFCSPAMGFYPEPFAYGGWLYATDGRICVRVPTTEPDTDEGVPTAVPDIFETTFREGPPSPWPPESGMDHIHLGGIRLDGKYDALIRTLSGVQHWQARDSEAPLPFTFDGGGEGLVMGVKV